MTCFGFTAFFAGAGRKDFLTLLLQQPTLELWQINEAVEIINEYGILIDDPSLSWVMELLLSAAAKAPANGGPSTPPQQSHKLTSY